MNAAQKVAVIGLGTAGSQVLLECARRGITVHGYEQHVPGHDLGAAGGNSRLYRTVLFEDSKYQPLAMLADEKWNQLEQDTQELLRHPTGSLLLGPSDHKQMVAASSYIESSGVAAEHFDSVEARRRFPHFLFEDGEEAIFDIGGAIIRPERTIRTAVTQASRLGAAVRQNSPVRSLTEESEAVTVTTAAGHTEKYDAAVIATGPWLGAEEFIPSGSSVVKRPISGWYLANTTGSGSLDYGFIRTGPEHFYGVGALDGYEIKIGLSANQHFKERDPHTHNPVPTSEEIQPLNSVVEKYLPGLNPHPIRSHAYMEAYTTDGHPMVGYSPGRQRVVLATGFSGKGFKFAPAIGAVVTDLIADGTSQCPIDLLDPARPSLN